MVVGGQFGIWLDAPPDGSRSASIPDIQDGEIALEGLPVLLMQGVTAEQFGKMFNCSLSSESGKAHSSWCRSRRLKRRTPEFVDAEEP